MRGSLKGVLARVDRLAARMGPSAEGLEAELETMSDENLEALIVRQVELVAGPADGFETVDAFLDAVKDALRDQKNIEIRGFGTFKIRRRKTRMARNPRTGEPVEVAARPVPVFKPSKELRGLVADADPAAQPAQPPAQEPPAFGTL